MSKCTYITFTHRQATEVFNYKISDQFLLVISQVKDLGILFSSNLSFVNLINIYSETPLLIHLPVNPTIVLSI